MGDVLPAYRVAQDGMIVARVECRDDASARREVDHYAAMYAQDGAVLVQQRKGKRWVALYILAANASDSKEHGDG